VVHDVAYWVRKLRVTNDHFVLCSPSQYAFSAHCYARERLGLTAILTAKALNAGG
jgi:hypothetical protein